MYDQITQLVDVTQSVGHAVSMKVRRVERQWEVLMTLNGDEEKLLGNGASLGEALTELNGHCASILAELEDMA